MNQNAFIKQEANKSRQTFANQQITASNQAITSPHAIASQQITTGHQAAVGPTGVFYQAPGVIQQVSGPAMPGFQQTVTGPQQIVHPFQTQTQGQQAVTSAHAMPHLQMTAHQQAMHDPQTAAHMAPTVQKPEISAALLQRRRAERTSWLAVCLGVALLAPIWLYVVSHAHASTPEAFGGPVAQAVQPAQQPQIMQQQAQMMQQQPAAMQMQAAPMQPVVMQMQSAPAQPSPFQRLPITPQMQGAPQVGAASQGNEVVSAFTDPSQAGPPIISPGRGRMVIVGTPESPRARIIMCR